MKEYVETLASKIFKPKTELDALEQTTVKPSILKREAAPLDLSQINSIMKNKEFEQAWKNYKISIRKVGRRKYDKDQFFEMWARENMAQGGRIGYAEAKLVDPDNKVKKNQDLGRGIQQRLKGKKIVYVTSGLGEIPLTDHKTYKAAKDFRQI